MRHWYFLKSTCSIRTPLQATQYMTRSGVVVVVGGAPVVVHLPVGGGREGGPANTDW